jgi:hypothetical protein
MTFAIEFLEVKKVTVKWGKKYIKDGSSPD